MANLLRPMRLHRLIEHYLGDRLVPSEPSVVKILNCLEATTFRKGEKVMEEDKQHDYLYFIQRGAARSYYLKDGLEVTNWFAFENDSVGSVHTYWGGPSRETIEFLEDSACLRINVRTLREEQRNDLLVSHFVGAVIEEYAVFLEDRLRQLQHTEGLDRYLYILEHEPYLLQRVPLTYLASYLGMTRETLSRLRAKIHL